MAYLLAGTPKQALGSVFADTEHNSGYWFGKFTLSFPEQDTYDKTQLREIFDAIYQVGSSAIQAAYNYRDNAGWAAALKNAFGFGHEADFDRFVQQITQTQTAFGKYGSIIHNAPGDTVSGMLDFKRDVITAYVNYQAAIVGLANAVDSDNDGFINALLSILGEATEKAYRAEAAIATYIVDKFVHVFDTLADLPAKAEDWVKWVTIGAFALGALYLTKDSRK